MRARQGGSTNNVNFITLCVGVLLLGCGPLFWGKSLISNYPTLWSSTSISFVVLVIKWETLKVSIMTKGQTHGCRTTDDEHSLATKITNK